MTKLMRGLMLAMAIYLNSAIAKEPCISDGEFYRLLALYETLCISKDTLRPRVECPEMQTRLLDLALDLAINK